MKRIFRFALLATVTASLLLSACKPTVVELQASDLTANTARRLSDEGSYGEHFLTSLTELSFDLYRGNITEAQSKNVLISPLSAALCLAMATAGAEGQTLAELETLYGTSASELHPSFFAYSRDLMKEQSGKSPLKIANSAWIRESFKEQVKEKYLQNIVDWYDASVYATPFDQSTAPDINRWVSDKTDGMIPKLFDDLNGADFEAILINAIAFTDQWAEPYKKSNILEDTFYNRDGSQKKTKMMSSTENIYLSGMDGLEGGFAKLYENGRFAFVALLPEKNTDVVDFAKALDGKTWSDLWENKKSRATVKAQLPAFTYQTDMDLIPTLSDLGITNLFSGEGLTGVADERLIVSEIRQVAFIDVSEQGTKAAAVTEIGMKNTAVMPDFKTYSVILNRPFVYLIVDFDTGMPIFIGTVVNL